MTNEAMTAVDELEDRLSYVVKMARQYEAAVQRVPEAVHGAGERLEQAKRELLTLARQSVGVEEVANAIHAALSEDEDALIMGSVESGCTLIDGNFDLRVIAEAILSRLTGEPD